jgi:hypothetical protein
VNVETRVKQAKCSGNAADAAADDRNLRIHRAQPPTNTAATAAIL